MTKDPTEGKMGPKWEGPYKVVGCHQKRGLPPNDRDREYTPEIMEY
jgi:hypothetical protein